MGIHLLVGRKVNDSDEPGAVMFCSTSGLAFGPVFESEDEADRFVEWANRQVMPDIRTQSQDECAETVHRWRNRYGSAR